MRRGKIIFDTFINFRINLFEPSLCSYNLIIINKLKHFNLELEIKTLSLKLNLMETKFNNRFYK